MVVELWQSDCPIKPSGMDFHVSGIIACDDMVHGGNVTTVSDRDGLSGFDRQRGKSSGFGADLVHGNGTHWVNEPGVVAQTVDFLPGAVDTELAVVFDEGGAPEIKRSCLPTSGMTEMLDEKLK